MSAGARDQLLLLSLAATLAEASVHRGKCNSHMDSGMRNEGEDLPCRLRARRSRSTRPSYTMDGSVVSNTKQEEAGCRCGPYTKGATPRGTPAPLAFLLTLASQGASDVAVLAVFSLCLRTLAVALLGRAPTRSAGLLLEFDRRELLHALRPDFEADGVAWLLGGDVFVRARRPW